MESLHKEPFAELKKVAARLDVEIANAANCLSGPVKALPTNAFMTFEQAKTFEAQFKLLERRLEAVVKEKLASIQEMTDCLENADCDNKDLLPKLLPLGLKVPDDVLPILQHMPSGQDSADETPSPTSCGLPCLPQPTVTKLEPVFSSVATGSFCPSRTSQTSSHLRQRSLQLRNSKPASRSPARPHSQGKSKLDRYLEEIGNDDSLLFLRRKPLPEEDFGAAANTASASYTSVKEPSEVFEFRGLMQALTDETYTCGVEPLPKTPEPKKSAFEEEENKTTWTRTELKTPELKESPTPVLKESNLGVPW
ncbi:uncharacterized protein LOC144098923 isoform X2 [Amblyomma americanum]